MIQKKTTENNLEKEFNEILKELKYKVRSKNDIIIKKLFDKKFEYLIKRELNEDTGHTLFYNLMKIVMIRKYKLDHDYFKELFSKSIKEYPYKLASLSEYLYVLKKKDYCDLLTEALYKHDNIPSITPTIIGTIGELGCTSCYNKLKEIAVSKETEAPIINFAAKYALKELAKKSKHTISTEMR
tara:strand:+ start:2893 stop:3444 length:552 start_codon:yes stop_codon:yes gene_type:complete